MTTAVDTRRGRFYPFKGHKYVSVTTIIGDGVPKPALANWKVRTVAEVAAKNRKELAKLSEAQAKDWIMEQRLFGGEAAASLGSSLHSMFDMVVRGDKFSYNDEAAPYIEAFHRFLNDYKPEYIETEATVYSKKHGYAGTLDFIATIDGKVVIGDYKTGKGVWPEAALQISAYKYADFIGRPDGREDELPSCDGSVVLHIRPEGYKFIDVDTSPAVFDSFLSALDVYRWVNIDSKNVIRGNV